MRRPTAIALFAAFVAAAAVASTGLASAGVRGLFGAGPDRVTVGAVFVQTNDLERNEIVAFDRADDGFLTEVGSFPTAGRGGAQVDNPFDPLASQGSLVYDEAHRMLFAVNAGSNSVTTFRVEGSVLLDRQVVSSGGEFPVSVAVSGDLVYVLNAGGEGIVYGFRIVDGRLLPIPDSGRPLGLDNATPPLFTDSPAQVGFSPDGGQLLVTTKTTNTIEVFKVDEQGLLSEKPVSNPSVGNVPFAFTFDAAGHLLVTEAEQAAVTSYVLNADGTLEVITPSAATGQQVLCWIEEAGGFFYGSNTGSSTLSVFHVDEFGGVTVGGQDGVVAVPGGRLASEDVAGAGPIDMSATADGGYLYVQNTLAGTVEGYRVEDDGSLSLVAWAGDPLPIFVDGAGMEGIVAI